MDVENIPIGEIVPYNKNPRKNDKAVDVVANSIKEFGFKQPIVLDKNNVIVVGHTRLLAAQKLGLTEVPIIWADDLTAEQIKAYRIMDNKSSEFSYWDFEALKDEFHDLEGKNEFALTGFSDLEITKIWDSKPGDYSEKNREISIDELTNELNCQCPRCGFQFKND